MYTQLWRCDNCGWGTFDPLHPRKMMLGHIQWPDGRTGDICQECLKALDSVQKHELTHHVASPTRPVRNKS